MSWQQDIPGTFGDQDLIFSGHSLDADRALDLLKECYKSNVSLKDVLDEAEKYLKSKGAGAQHIAEQLEVIRGKFDGWLN
jgi:hypothetical protein